MPFQPRSGNYIKQKRGRYYYRRAIPDHARHLLGGKGEWVIALQGQNDTERQNEAQALAHKHTQQIRMADELQVDSLAAEAADAVAIRIDLASNLPDGVTPTPARFLRDGQIVETYRYAVTDDSAARRKAEADGFFVMGQTEARAQLELQKHMASFAAADTPERAEIADLKAERATREVEASARASGESVLSLMPRWRDHRKQAVPTWKKHVQYVAEFTELHGDLPLSAVTKRHVIEYVENAQKLQYRGKPLAPTAITKRLDSIRALLAFAVEADEIANNPATGVRAPKDHRPKTARSWKSFDLEEIQKLVAVSTDLWTSRRNSRQPGRREDLMTALQVLIWTGARPEEVCQLRREDVDLVHGAIRITNDESDDEARARITKNESSIRTVPIHSRLTAALTEHLHRHNSPLLFPSFEPVATASELAEAERTGRPVEIKGRYARPLSREWTDNLRTLIAPDDPRKVLYSLRHSWAAESRRTGMPEHVRNALMGHDDDNRHASRYGGDADWTEEKRRHVERMTCA